jgi:hypothetical protein
MLVFKGAGVVVLMKNDSSLKMSTYALVLRWYDGGDGNTQVTTLKNEHVCSFLMVVGCW